MAWLGDERQKENMCIKVGNNARAISVSSTTSELLAYLQWPTKPPVTIQIVILIDSIDKSWI